MVDVSIIWNDAELAAFAAHGAGPQAALSAVAAKVQIGMKVACPVSPVYPVSGQTAPGGTRRTGDFPLRPSGKMRSSIRRIPQPDGSILVGTADPAAKYVINGTSPHEITSHGPWPLRNRATGQVFGRTVRHPGTQANNFVLKGLETARGVVLHA